MTDLSVSQYGDHLLATTEKNQVEEQRIGAEIHIEQLHKFYGDDKV